MLLLVFSASLVFLASAVITNLALTIHITHRYEIPTGIPSESLKLILKKHEAGYLEIEGEPAILIK